MRILGLDTGTRATAVAFVDTTTGAVVERRDDPPAGSRPRHTARLMSLIAAALHASGGGWGEVDRIAVGIGPGTFTGLRIGVSTARALAMAREIELVGISTLHALACGAQATAQADGRGVIAVLDARRGEAFAAAWSSDDDEAVLAPAALAPARLADAVAALPSGWLAVGEGAVEFRTVLEHSGAAVPEDGSDLHRVSAIDHCWLAADRPPQTVEDVQPEYLRLPDAELALRARRS